MFYFAALGAENSEKIDENSDKEMEIEESSEKMKVQTAPKVEEEQDLKVCIIDYSVEFKKYFLKG